MMKIFNDQGNRISFYEKHGFLRADAIAIVTAEQLERIADALEKQNAGASMLVEGLAKKFECAREKVQKELQPRDQL